MEQNPSKQEELRNRTKRFALRIIRLFRYLPRTTEAQVLGKQLLRSGTSIGANYRAAGRARSKAEFIAKMGLVVEEADETVFWIECLTDSRICESGPAHGFTLRSERTARNFRRISTNGSGLILDDPMARSPDDPIFTNLYRAVL